MTAANGRRVPLRWRGIAALAVLVGLAGTGCSSPTGLPQESARSDSSPNANRDDGPKREEPTFRLEDFGAVCDGRHDDRPALQAAAQAAARMGGGAVAVPRGSCRIVATAARPTVALGSRVTLAGAGPRASSLLLDTDEPSAYRELLRTAGDDIAVTDLTLTSTAGIYGVFVQIDAGRGLNLADVVIDGPGLQSGQTPLHGLSLPIEGVLQDVRIHGVTIRGVEYGLFQRNESTATVTGFTVVDSTFTDNHADDLSFNAPKGIMRNVLVQNSDFSGGGGFGISLANVQDVVLRGNRLRDKAKEFVHIEDRSSDVLIEGNIFSGNGPNTQDWYSFVLVINGSDQIDITGNTFRTSPAATPFQCVYVSPGGDGRPAPQDVTVRNNEADLTENTVLVSSYGDSDVVVAG